MMSQKNIQLKTPKAISLWLKEHNINRFQIYDNLSVDVFDNVTLVIPRGITQCPVKFNTIEGDFQLSDSDLNTLVNMPSCVKGDLLLFNNNIETLIGMSSEVTGFIDLADNQIKNLKGITTHIHKNLYLPNNPLSELNLQDLPQYVGKQIDLSNRHVRLERFEKLGLYKSSGSLKITLTDLKAILLEEKLSSELPSHTKTKPRKI